MTPPNGLCVGLDIDLTKLPSSIRGHADPIVAFNRAVIEATRDVAACYKINVAFYERLGLDGLSAMYATRDIIGDSYVIIDAKRGDVGSTSAAYADAVFKDLRADAVTVSPYMGRDSVAPFLEFAGRMTYILALTSNPGSQDFQRADVGGVPFFQHVMRTAMSWPSNGDIGFVVGATHAAELSSLRGMFPEVPFLIPGIGTQGADAAEVVGANAGGPAVFNVSRSLTYLGENEDFADLVRAEALRLAAILS